MTDTNPQDATQEKTFDNGNKPEPVAVPAAIPPITSAPPAPATTSAPPTNAQIAEAVIIDEQIMRVPPKNIPVAPAAATPVTPVTVPENIETPSLPPTPINIPGLVKTLPTSAAEIAPPQKIQPQLQSQDSAATPSTDITKILEDVKLPPRHDQKGAADVSTSPNVSPPDTPPELTSIAATVMPTLPSINGLRQTQEKQSSLVRAVRTLKDDLQSLVHERKMSVVHAVSLEEDRRGHENKPETPATEQRSKRTFAILFTVALLFLIGGSAIFGILTVMQQHTSTPPAQKTSPSSILFAEQSILFSLSDHSASKIKQTLAAARTSSPATLGSITRILPIIATTSPDGKTQNAPATFTEFMQAIGAHAPDDLLRALSSDFFLGLHSVDRNAPLIVVPVISYDRVFASMLAWEGAMNADLAPAWTAVSRQKTDQNGIPSERTFEDLIMRNHDVRALKDDTGEIQLYYSFPTQKILVIAESPYSFPEILNRLQARPNAQ